MSLPPLAAPQRSNCLGTPYVFPHRFTYRSEFAVVAHIGSSVFLWDQPHYCILLCTCSVTWRVKMIHAKTMKTHPNSLFKKYCRFPPPLTRQTQCIYIVLLSFRFFCIHTLLFYHFVFSTSLYWRPQSVQNMFIKNWH